MHARTTAFTLEVPEELLFEASLTGFEVGSCFHDNSTVDWV